MSRRLLFALGLGSVLALAGRAGAGEPPPLDAWPAWVRDARPVAGIARTRILGPLFERWETVSGERGGTLRPLFSWQRIGPRRELAFLHPLGGYVDDGERRRFRVTPFVDRSWASAPVPQDAGVAEESAAESHTFGPVFWGRTAEGRRWGGVFPLGGVVRERFGRERVAFALFPLYGRVEHPDGFERHILLWPFFSWGRGGGRRLLRIWPFYGHDLREGEWERRFALWPFFHWRRERIGSGGETATRLFLPFYGTSRSAHADSRLLLGNLLLWSRNHRSGARSVDVLWPVFRFAHEPGPDGTEGRREWRAEPVFRLQTHPDGLRLRMLLGLVDWRRADTQTGSERGLRILAVNRFEWRRDTATGVARRRVAAWPLLFFREDRVGEEPLRARLVAPWLLPFPGDAWQRHLLGLTTLLDARWLGDEVRTDVLFGLWRRQRTPTYGLDALSPFWARQTEGDAPARWRVLGVPLP